MSARRIARELAIILFPQVPKGKADLEKLELDQLAGKAVQMLVDYAKQRLADADALRVKAEETLLEIESEHPFNEAHVETLVPVPLTSEQLREELALIEQSIDLVSEALDIPELSFPGNPSEMEITCAKCSHTNRVSIQQEKPYETRDFLYRLLRTYAQNQKQVDDFIRHAKAKWKIERMVSIDRDILRLACVEAYFLHDVPIPVAINEAVELSHRFADQKAAKFINGILGDLAVEARQYRKLGTAPERQADSTYGQEATIAALSGRPTEEDGR